MTTFAHKIGLLLIATTLALLAPAQNRGIQWVHGNGSNSGAWARYQALTQRDRLVNQVNENYVTANGNVVATADVRADLLSSVPGALNRNNTLGIGHSYGGLVVRELARTNTGTTRLYNGIITVGSPNFGARAAVSLTNGDVGRAAQNGCRELAAGPASERIVVRLLDEFNTNAEELCQLGIGFLTGGLAGTAATPTIGELAPGSAFLTTLNSTPSNVPAISIRGVEESPVHWRLGSSFLAADRNDSWLVDASQQVRGIYVTLRNVHRGIQVLNILRGPFGWRAAAREAGRARAWNRGINWLDASETIYTGLIGCNGERVTRSITVTGNPCFDFPNRRSLAYLNCAAENNCPQFNCDLPRTITTTTTINTRSDGLVCNDNQYIAGLPPANYYEARGVNHSEETNTGAMTTGSENGRPRGDVMLTIFASIFNRPEPPFNTPPRG